MEELSNGWQRTDTVWTQKKETSGHNTANYCCYYIIETYHVHPRHNAEHNENAAVGRLQYPPKGILNAILIWG